MTEYTPTTEQVRRYWQYGANAWLAGVADDRDDGPDGSIGAEFDRWLDAHDREVRAEALSEAADWLAGMDDGRDTPQHRAGRDIIACLRDRAALTLAPRVLGEEE